jgi:hypothetical protein
VEAAKAEVEEGRRHEGEDREEEEEPEQAAVRKEAADSCEEACGRMRAALGGREEGERRRRTPAAEEPSHSLPFPLLRLRRTEETKGLRSTRTSSPASATQQATADLFKGDSGTRLCIPAASVEAQR